MTPLSRPMWPPYRRHSKREHTLADEIDDCRLVTVDGEIMETVSYADFVAIALARRLDVRVHVIAAWHWLPEAIADDRASVFTVQNSQDLQPRVVSISWQKGRDHATLFSAESWPEKTTLEDIQSTCDALGQGVYASPGSLGDSTMRAWTQGRYTTASERCNLDLKAALIGGRAELLHAIRVKECVEIDRRMSYVAEAREPLPIGTAGRIGGPELPDYPAYLVRCVVYIKSRLKVGPFPLRRADGTLSYPTKVGTYEDVLLTKGECEDTLKAGCQIIVRDGWAWTQTAPVLAEWAEKMFAARMSASGNVADCIKKVALAAIGRHAMVSNLGQVVLTDEPTEQAVPFGLASGLTGAFVEPVDDNRPHQMLIWAVWIWSLARQSLYRRQLAEERDNNWLGYTNFDSILLKRPSRQPISAGLGEWRSDILTNVWTDASRHLVCDQKDTRPGVDKRMRVDPRTADFMSLDALAAYLGGDPTLKRQQRADGGVIYALASGGDVSGGSDVTDTGNHHSAVPTVPDVLFASG